MVSQIHKFLSLRVYQSITNNVGKGRVSINDTGSDRYLDKYFTTFHW